MANSDPSFHEFEQAGWENAGVVANYHEHLSGTFNGLAFDQFILFVKVVQHGLDLPRFSLRVPRFDKGDLHLDLRRVLSNDDKFARGTLGQWATRFGYDGAVLEHSGGEIRDLFAEEKWEEIHEKCKTDVELVRFIHSKIGGYL